MQLGHIGWQWLVHLKILIDCQLCVLQGIMFMLWIETHHYLSWGISMNFDHLAVESRQGIDKVQRPSTNMVPVYCAGSPE